MFVDASAIIAILTREAEAQQLAKLLEDAELPITSPVQIFEAVLGLCRKRQITIGDGEQDVREFLHIADIRTVPITDEQATMALDACARYGRGRGHPAQLNMGDCFAYAVAQSHGVPLLFKGDDFSKTDAMTASAPS